MEAMSDERDAEHPQTSSNREGANMLVPLAYNRFRDAISGYEYEWDIRDLPEHTRLRFALDHATTIMTCVATDSWHIRGFTEIDRSKRVLVCQKQQLRESFEYFVRMHARLSPGKYENLSFDELLPQVLAGWREMMFLSSEPGVFPDVIVELIVE